ncbi:hypothetical protein HZB00_02145 [Candidatus Woesearchaeota archaeon]|nr:hypothetical protein [Candidatus Woesearchaeota archaeon]
MATPEELSQLKQKFVEEVEQFAKDLCVFLNAEIISNETPLLLKKDISTTRDISSLEETYFPVYFLQTESRRFFISIVPLVNFSSRMKFKGYGIIATVMSTKIAFDPILVSPTQSYTDHQMTTSLKKVKDLILKNIKDNKSNYDIDLR